jgi:anti-anti-sigma regulatory factor
MESKAYILASSEDNTVTIQVVGSMDMRLYSQLHELVRTHRHREGLRYVFDWSQTFYLHDSGVATLLKFGKWIAGQQAFMEFANCGSHILQSFTRTGTMERFVPAFQCN